MSNITPATDPILSWWQVWAGATGYDEGGRAFITDMPQGVRLAVQPAEKSPVVIQIDQPWEGPTLGSASVLHEGGRYRIW
ncbi:MAG: hypothetical protein HY326_03860, partial [Chloroflexi bacterium]|nr:hypothetical protein [Chloroflexota bacterium]